MTNALYFLHAMSPIHAGIGQGLGVIDLPIAREKPTGLPLIPSSSIKGVLRDASNSTHTEAVFGPDTDKASEHMGAITLGDAKLLCLPVRSLYGTLAYVTSPFILRRLQRDIEIQGSVIPTGCSLTSISIQSQDLYAYLGTGTDASVLINNGKAYLEDLDLTASTHSSATEWGNYLGPLLFPNDADGQQEFKKRLALISDDAFFFLCETATEINARIRIRDETKTVANGALWYEEALPAESILWGLAFSEIPKKKDDPPLTDVEVMEAALGSPNQVRFLQFGGKSTVGRGRARLLRV